MSAAGRTAIVAHDAGGAEVLSSHVRRQGLDCLFSLQGPARAVFERKLGPFENLPLEAALAGSARLLCGTSWQSDLELEAIALARRAGLPSAAWLDHWVNYRARFERGGALRLPDEIWVSDDCALALARAELPQVRLRQMENPYFLDIAASLRAEPRLFPALPGRLNVLYVCEPVREHALLRYGDELHFGYTEEQALRYFLNHVAALGAPLGRVLIRPHPSEAAGKYTALAAEFALPLAFSAGDTLSAEVASSDCVVGCSSMAMVIGLIGGKRVVSCIPPGGPPCALPQPEIESLRALLAQ
ncbi:hypothetical protein [Janthinobacterium sp.]|uniref:hypothetical protein n=1 Tax=Janthinobacterium sp. TaxID=1871054 RepID=UPI00293D32B1|nr:hypothetical protein [Janthinobacterium sp.]